MRTTLSRHTPRTTTLAIACLTAAVCASTGQAHAGAVTYRSCGEAETVTGLEVSDNQGDIIFQQNTTYNLTVSFTPRISIAAKEAALALYTTRDAELMLDHPTGTAVTAGVRASVTVPVRITDQPLGPNPVTFTAFVLDHSDQRVATCVEFDATIKS